MSRISRHGKNATRDISKFQNSTRLTAREVTYNNFEISLVVFVPCGEIRDMSGRSYFPRWSTCQSMISHLWFLIGLLLTKCHESFARPHRLLLCHVLWPLGNLSQIYSQQEFLQRVDNFSTAFMNKIKWRNNWNIFWGGKAQLRKKIEGRIKSCCLSVVPFVFFLVDIYFQL